MTNTAIKRPTPAVTTRLAKRVRTEAGQDVNDMDESAANNPLPADDDPMEDTSVSEEALAKGDATVPQLETDDGHNKSGAADVPDDVGRGAPLLSATDKPKAASRDKAKHKAVETVKDKPAPAAPSTLPAPVKRQGASATTTTGKKKWQPKIPAAKPPIKEGLGCTEDRNLGTLTLVNVASMEGTIPGDVSVVERLESILKMPGAFPSAINLCTVDPTKLTKKVGRQLMTAAEPHRFAVFFLLGVLTHDAMDLMDGQLTKHVCIAPFQSGFGRALAVLRHVFAAPYLLFSTFRGGITFSTGRYISKKLPGEPESDEEEDEDETEEKEKGKGGEGDENENEKKGDEANVKKPKIKARFNAVLGKTSEVPVYDGRYSKFLWSKYKSVLPRYKRDGRIQRGTVCAVTFTIGSYPPKPRPMAPFDSKVVKTAMSFNIQSLIVLETPAQDEQSWAIGTHELDYNGVQRDKTLSLQTAMNNTMEAGSPEPEEDENEEEA